MTFRDRRVPRVRSPPPLHRGLTTPRRPPAPRIRVDLRKGLSATVRYTLAIAIVVGVSIAAWLVGRDDPTPAWISEGLVPALGWIYLALVAVAAVHWIRKLRAKRKHHKEHTR